MASLRTWLLAGALSLAVPGPAWAVSIADLVKLTAAGLSDDILVALIQSDGSVFALTADDVLSLRARGLSERVLLAMIRTRVVAAPEASGVGPPASAVDLPPPGIDPVPAPREIPEEVVHHVVASAAPPPVVVFVEPAGRPREYQTVPVAVPVYVPVYVPVSGSPHKAAAPPVYWGWGGERRPDAWRDKDARRKDR
jgi:hypothetical protein